MAPDPPMAVVDQDSILRFDFDEELEAEARREEQETLALLAEEVEDNVFAPAMRTKTLAEVQEERAQKLKQDQQNDAILNSHRKIRKQLLRWITKLTWPRFDKIPDRLQEDY